MLSTGERSNVAAVDCLDETKSYDLVIVTTDAHQIEPLLAVLARSMAKSIQFMFVTPEWRRLAEAVGSDRTTFGFAGALSTFTPDGSLNLQIPKRRPKAMHGDSRWVDVFEKAGMPSMFEQDMGDRLRVQAPLLAAMESVAVASMRQGRGATWAQARIGQRGLRAGAAVLREVGGLNGKHTKTSIAGAPGPLLTFALWWIASRNRFRFAIGTSAGEAAGLIDLLVAEARSRANMIKYVQDLLSMRSELLP